MNKGALFILLGVFYIYATTIGAQNSRPATNNAQDMQIFYHTVESGQTVFSLAKMYDVMVLDIHKLNPGSENGIKVGDRLKIPQRKFEEKSVLNNTNSKTTNTNNKTTNENSKATNADSKTTNVDNKKRDDDIIHTIQKGETLIGISRIYGINPDSILDANPGLSQKTFSAGRKIRVPKPVQQKPATEIVEKKGEKEVYYTVPSNETIYNICKKFKTTEKELLNMNPELAGGLRAGMTIRIPLRISESDIPKEELIKPRPTPVVPPVSRANMIKIALILPFDANNRAMTDLKRQMVAYYEGLLLSVDSLRKQGISPELFLHDCDTSVARTRRLLQDKNEELKKMHLIIGGYTIDQIKLFADFAKQNAIKYVIPFSQKTEEIEALDNEFIFQVNPQLSYLYPKAAFAGANLFAKHHIIFLDTKDTLPQYDFIRVFKQELKDRNISYKDAVYESDSFEENIKSLLSTSKPNMIMPVSLSLDALQKIKPILRLIAETNPEYNLTLFGYPRWQTYTYSKDCLDCLEDFHALNTYIYSSFYANNIHPGVKAFYEKYKNWYSKSPVAVYSLLGFDTGMYFISALKKFGTKFEDHLSEMNYNSLQTGFDFERFDESGCNINKNIYIIHFNRDYTIDRSQYK